MVRFHASSRFTARHLLLACVAAAVLGAAGYRLYSPSGHTPLPPIDVPVAGGVRAVDSQQKPADQSLSPLDDLVAAQREIDPERRATRIRTALHAWTRMDPDAAAKWVLAQPAQHRLVDASVVLIALADRAEDAERIANYFCKGDSSHVREHGNSLIAVLSAAGEFDRALKFAGLGGPERSEWVTHAFASWTELVPSDAARAALAFDGDEAISAVFATWAARNRAIANRTTSGAADLAAAQRAVVVALAQGKTGG